MPIHLIFARARNGVIGKNNQLPWHLPEDLAHFKRTTLGQPVIMGRKTWDSLPLQFRPLPGRTNIVVTRQTDWQAPGATVAHSLAQAQSLCDPQQTVWVIGGAEIYAQALPLARKAVITDIDLAVADGDAFAPQFGPHWQQTHREDHVSAQGLAFSFITLERKGD
jgi:dihydrofolate reductase